MNEAAPRLASSTEVQASDELIDWLEKYMRRVPHGTLAGMLASAAAELLTSVPHASRELFIEIAARAWDNWKLQKQSGVIPS